MKFLLYLIWQILRPILEVLCIPFILVFIVLMYPVAFVYHHYEVFKGRRPSYVGVFAIRGIDYK